MTQITRIGIGSLLFVTLAMSAFTPAFAFAKEDKSERRQQQFEKKIDQLQKRRSERVSVDVKAQIDAALKASPITLDEWDDFENLTTLWWAKCLPFIWWKHSTWKNCFNNASSTDAAAPVISDLAVSPATSSAVIRWKTNEAARGKVFFGTELPLTKKNTRKETKNGATEHQVTLKRLAPGTTYHFFILASDKAGNTASSTVRSFTTLGTTTADTTAPGISALAVGGIGSTTATVSWNTNEAADGRVYYATGSPVNTNTAPFLSASSFTFSKLFTLISLTASTTYHLLIEATDPSGNKSTTTTSFTTAH